MAIYYIIDKFSHITFIDANHDNNHTPGWDNDRLLILIKK
jgi:hypothetical protein